MLRDILFLTLALPLPACRDTTTIEGQVWGCGPTARLNVPLPFRAVPANWMPLVLVSRVAHLIRPTADPNEGRSIYTTREAEDLRILHNLFRT